MVQNIPGTTDVDVRENDLLFMAVNTVDNRLDDILGIRPLRGVARVLTAVAPANAISNLTGMDKPSVVIEQTMDRVESDIRGKKIGGRRF